MTWKEAVANANQFNHDCSIVLKETKEKMFNKMASCKEFSELKPFQAEMDAEINRRIIVNAVTAVDFTEVGDKRPQIVYVRDYYVVK